MCVCACVCVCLNEYGESFCLHIRLYYGSKGVPNSFLVFPYIITHKLKTFTEIFDFYQTIINSDFSKTLIQHPICLRNKEVKAKCFVNDDFIILFFIILELSVPKIIGQLSDERIICEVIIFRSFLAANHLLEDIYFRMINIIMK